MITSPEFSKCDGKFRTHLFFLLFLSALTTVPTWAQAAEVKTTGAPVTIETQWDSMWGMKYLQSGEELKEPKLRLELESQNDPEITRLIKTSEDDDTLAAVSLWTSIIVSVGCLALPSTEIHLGSLNIVAPYLPVQIPALAAGVLAAFLTNAANAARYQAVQRYNSEKTGADPVTWDISPRSDHLDLDIKYQL